tara:strand:+ start:897 stop:1106 length:210 start_codon:yes stop_codon:yes gene_type:complete
MGKWIGGKGSDRRPKKVSDEQFQDNWEKIFGKKEPKIKSRKHQPDHSLTQVHKDKTKVIPRKEKYKSID